MGHARSRTALGRHRGRLGPRHFEPVGSVRRELGAKEAGGGRLGSKGEA